MFIHLLKKLYKADDVLGIFLFLFLILLAYYLMVQSEPFNEVYENLLIWDKYIHGNGRVDGFQVFLNPVTILFNGLIYQLTGKTHAITYCSIFFCTCIFYLSSRFAYKLDNRFAASLTFVILISMPFNYYMSVSGKAIIYQLFCLLASIYLYLYFQVKESRFLSICILFIGVLFHESICLYLLLLGFLWISSGIVKKKMVSRVLAYSVWIFLMLSVGLKYTSNYFFNSKYLTFYFENYMSLCQGGVWKNLIYPNWCKIGTLYMTYIPLVMVILAVIGIFYLVYKKLWIELLCMTLPVISIILYYTMMLPKDIHQDNLYPLYIYTAILASVGLSYVFKLTKIKHSGFAYILTTALLGFLIFGNLVQAKSLVRDIRVEKEINKHIELASKIIKLDTTQTKTMIAYNGKKLYQLALSVDDRDFYIVPLPPDIDDFYEKLTVDYIIFDSYAYDQTETNQFLSGWGCTIFQKNSVLAKPIFTNHSLCIYKISSQ